MASSNYEDISSYLNNLIKVNKDKKALDTKLISDGHHTFGDLYTRERVLFRLITCVYPKLSFKSLYHYDEQNDPMFDGDFIVGIYTPKGPVSYHLKLEYLDDFSHIDFLPRAPKYDNYTESEKNERIIYLANMIIAGKTENDIINEIVHNINLDDSLKPIQFVKHI